METTSPYRIRLWAYLQLLRPANIVTALADVLAGFAVAGATLSLSSGTAPAEFSTLGCLLLATTGLYGGGVVLNDVFDAQLDAAERPERPLPSGRASRRGAAFFGGLLLIGGIAAASRAQPVSAGLAALIAGGSVLYNARAKHHAFFGPLTMGLCRGGNLLLGVSATPAVLMTNGYLLLLPVVYIGAITIVSQGEVHGGMQTTSISALLLLTVVLGGLLALGFRNDYRLWHALPLIFLFGAQVGSSFVRVARRPTPKHSREAVHAGVLALIPFDSALAAGFAGWTYGVGVLLLLPISIGLSRIFAIT